jgi:hypothetical protein
VVEGRLIPDLVHLLIAISLKTLVSQVGGFIKGKIAIQIDWNCQGQQKNCVFLHFGQGLLCVEARFAWGQFETIFKNRERKQRD